MWERVLKLENVLPKQLISRNRKQITELSYAIALTKLGDITKAELFTKRAVQALERELKINKTIRIEDNICPSNDPNEKSRFKVRMQSLCLAYHHLGSIKKSMNQYKKALDLFTLAQAISLKHVSDAKLQKIIKDDLEKMIPKPSPLFTKRASLVELEKLPSKSKVPDEKDLLSDIFGKNKVKKFKDVRRADSFSGLQGNLNDGLTSISQNIHEETFKKKKSTFKREILDEPGNKLRLVNEISYLRKVETKAVLCIQRFYRGYRARNNVKSMVQQYIARMDPKSSQSSNREHSKPVITIFSYEDSVNLKVPDSKSQDRSSRSHLTEDRAKKGSDSESSEPDILVKVQQAQAKAKISKATPSLFDYLNLHVPELFISQSICGRIYTWRITIVRKKIMDGDLHCLFGIFGHYEKFTDCLVYFQEILIGTNKIDQRFLLPFPFETIWPVIEAELTKDEDKDDDESEEVQISDETAFTTIKDIANFILNRSTVESCLTGPRLVENHSFFNLIEKVTDFQPSRHLYAVDGVTKSMAQFAVHERGPGQDNKSYFKHKETALFDKVIEKGVCRVSSNYIVVQLKVVQAQKKSKFASALQVLANSTNSNWFDDIVMPWEDVVEYFNALEVKFDVLFVVCRKKFPARAREIFFGTFSDNFKIYNSRLIISRDEFKDEYFDSDIYETEDYDAEECHEEWEANLNEFASIYENEVDNVCLGIFPAIKLKGETDLIHLKFTSVNKSILIQGKRRLDDSKFVKLITEYTYAKRISRIFELGEVVKSILQHEISIKSGFCGKVLSFGRFKQSITHTSIRKIDGSQYLITVIVGEIFQVCLYNLSNSWQLITSFSRADLSYYFPNLESAEFAAIYYEETFVQPLLKNFSLCKGMLGSFSAWKRQEALEIDSDNSKRIQTFQFTVKESAANQEIVTTKSLFERKISKTLGLPDSFLTETVYQEIILLQRTRVVCGLYAMITLTKLVFLEEWRVYINFFSTSREFVCKIYNSDMFGLRQTAFDNTYPDKNHTVNKSSPSNKLWEILLAECTFEHHPSLDFVFKFDTIITPMRELLYSNHIHNSNFFYFEVYMKCSTPFHLKFSTITNIKDAEYIIITIRSYNLARKLWEKRSLKLKEVILELLNSGVVTEEILLNTLIAYSDLKFFAGCLCRVLKMKIKENTVQIKLLPSLYFSEEEVEDYFEERNSDVHSISSIFAQDLLLFQIVHKSNTTLIIGVHFNEFSEEFAFKVYKPRLGVIFRVPMSKYQIFRKISFSRTLLKEKAYLQLGKKIYSELIDRLLLIV